MQVNEQEAAAAARGFINRDGVLGGGLVFEGQKFFVLQADEERIIGKKESKGFFIYKTAQSELDQHQQCW